MLQKAIRTIRTLLPPVGSVTPEEIDEAVGTALFSTRQGSGYQRSSINL